MRTWIQFACIMLFVGPAAGLVHAQSVCLPAPRLLTTMPMGGMVGTQVELTVTGENLDDHGQLIFSTPLITAASKMDANGQPEKLRYVVTISPDCPPGIYEARVMSKLGISSSRIFSVGTLPEVLQKGPNTTPETAMPIEVNTVCNSTMAVRGIDHFVFTATKGQRYLIDCAARRVDSKLDAVLILADAGGRDLIVDRQGKAIDFVAPEDGRYFVKVHELTYKGGPEYFYRLTVQNLPDGAPLPAFASTRSVSSASWPPAGLPVAAALTETEPDNASGVVQTISLPCDLAGSFFAAADVDVYEFEAKKGEVWWIEVGSERLGRPTDPAVLIQRVVGEGTEQTLVDVTEFTDIPSPMKPSSNGYAYDGPPYDAGSPDVLGKFEVPEDGRYRLQISDLFGGTRRDPSNIYRLTIRQAAPDFAVVAWALHMELRNGDRNALSKPVALRAGGSMALEVVAIRRDGFDGDIELSMSDLPDGVSAQGLKIPAGKTRGIMVVTADQHAPDSYRNSTFTAKAVINGQEVVRSVQMAAMVWPVPDAWSEIPVPRLISDIPVSVVSTEPAPISVAANEKKVWEVRAGEKLTIPLIHTRRSEFSGSTMQLKAFGHGFEHLPPFDVSLTADGSEAVLDLNQLKTGPGDYVIAFYGSAVAKYRSTPEETPRDIVDIVVSEPISIRVMPTEAK